MIENPQSKSAYGTAAVVISDYQTDIKMGDEFESPKRKAVAQAIGTVGDAETGPGAAAGAVALVATATASIDQSAQKKQKL